MNLSNLDILSKVIISFLYRLVIVIFSIYILSSQSNTNFFDWYIYILIISLYLYLYIVLLEKMKSKRRLLNDFCFIGLILIGKDINVISNLVFILLPFFNAPNHTQKNRNILVLTFFAFITLIVVNLFSPNKLEINSYINIITSLCVISVIIYFEQVRTLFLGKIFESFELADSNTNENNKITSINSILNKLINIYNADILLDIFNIKNKNINTILCLNISPFINIVTSSSFIKNVSLEDSDLNKLKDLDEGKLLTSIPIKIENVLEENTYVIKTKKNRHTFYYFLILEEKTISNQNPFTSLLLSYITRDFFYPILKRITNRIIFDSKLRSTKRKQLSGLVKNLDYVTTTNNSLHFLRNKFGPIQTYFDLVNTYQELTNEGQKIATKKLIDREKNNAERAIIEVQKRANYILDKSNNPFEVKKIKKVKAKHIWMMLIDSWKFVIRNANIFTEINNDEMEKYYYNIDTTLFDILITDIVINISNHGTGNKQMDINLISETNDLHIKFTNELKEDKEKNDKLKKLAQHFNNNDRYEINRSATHGFSQIKELSLRLKIKTKMTVTSNELITELFIQKDSEC